MAASQAQVLLDEKNLHGSVLEKLAEIKKKGLKEASMIKNFAAPKKVDAKNRPFFLLQENKIYFNGKRLELGNSLNAWKLIIAGSPRCITESMILCVWDDLGLAVGTDDEVKQRVRFVNIHISFSEDEKSAIRVNYPDGTAAPALPDYTPSRVFPGYLELDGVGIDAKTTFSEIRAGLAESKLHCGLRDCSHPTGPFGERSNLYLRLDGNNENDTLLELSLSAVD